MIELNGKEYGLFYSVGVRCDYDEFVINNPACSMSRGYVKKAVLMSRAYCEINGGEPLTEEEINKLPYHEYEALVNAVKAQEATDSKVSVEVDARGNGKKAKSTAR